MKPVFALYLHRETRFRSKDAIKLDVNGIIKQYPLLECGKLTSHILSIVENYQKNQAPTTPTTVT